MKKVVYHGGGFGKEYFWFSSDKDVAASYGDIRMIDRGYSGISDTILDDFKAYEINIQNPYIIDAKEEYYMDIPTPQEMLDDDFWHSETVDTDGICEYAKKKGHDSVIIKNVVEGHGIYNIADDYVCFNKSQFKELYNNKEKVEELKKELHNLIKTYGKNLKDDNQFIEDNIFELYLKNPVKLKYKEISKFTAYDDYFMLGKENYMYEPYVIDKYEDLETIINAIKKEVKQPAMKNSKKLKESLEKMGDCFITKSPYDIVNLFKNKPKEYRVLYDKNIDMYMIGDAESVTHYDMIQKAYKDAYYYNMEDFIQDLGGTIDNYTEMGQSGYYDGEDDENFDAYLWYIVFSPNEEWELGTDGYNKRYDYPFGHVFTRGCDLSEIDLWDALGVPENSEKLNEEAYDYADLPLEDGEVFSNYIEVMIFSPKDNVQRIWQFIKDKDMVRCIIDKNMYLWDAKAATHGAMIDFLKKKYGCKYTYGNTFMFGRRTIDPTSLYDIKNHPEDIEEFLENYNYLKNLLGIDYMNQDYLKTVINMSKNKTKVLTESNLNDAFWKWFGKSKLIENGQPMIFYHRTNAVFDTFDKDFGSPLLADGFYFSTKPLSEWYGKNIMEVYLKMENPYIIEDMQNLNSVAKFVEDFSLLTEDIKTTLQNYSDEYRSNPNISFDGKAALRRVVKWHLNDQTKYVTERLQKKHYDGLIIKNSDGQDGIKYDEYIVFSPNQIKSINNKGMWSNSDNIYETLNKEIERYL